MAGGLRQSEGWARFLASQGWLVEELDGTKAYIRKLPLYGSVIKIQRPSRIPPIEAIDKIARRHHALFVKFEPGISKQLTPVPEHRSTRAELGTRQGSSVRGAAASSEQLRGFERDPNPNLPTKTIVIDLTKSEEELWQNLSQDARQSIKKATSYQLLAISYRYGESKFDEALKSFHQILRETGRRQNFWTPSFDQLKTKVGIFGKNAALFLAFPPSHKASGGQAPPVLNQPIAGHLRRPASPRGEASPLAGALDLIHDGISYGHLASSSEEGKKLYASYFLMWEMIKFFKNPKPHPPATPARPPATTGTVGHGSDGGRGTLPPKADPPLAENPIRYFDLEGIYDPRYHKFTKSWQGFTLFKRKFGGKEVTYPQPLIKYYHPAAKLLFKLGSLFCA